MKDMEVNGAHITDESAEILKLWQVKTEPVSACLLYTSLEKECSINSASDAYYLSAIAWFCLTFIFPPAVIGAAICVYRAKKVRKGGRK